MENQSDGENFAAGGTWTAGIHPQAIPGALKVQQDAIGKLQRTLRQDLAKLQAEEIILKLMIKRERRRLARQARRRADAPGGREPAAAQADTAAAPAPEDPAQSH